MATIKKDGTTAASKSTSQTGHAKNIANFDKLLEAIRQMGADYQPSKKGITLEKLEEKRKLMAKTMNTWNQKEKTAFEAENTRTALYAQLGPYSTRIAGALTVSEGVTPLTIKDVKSLLTKLRGKRAGKKPEPTTQLDGTTTPARTISVSQLGFDERNAFFKELNSIIMQQPSYAPNEADLTKDAIAKFFQKLEQSNLGTIKANTELQNARNLRNTNLYDPATGLVATAKDIKAYVKSVLGTAHPVYKQINSIPFSTVKK